MSSATPLIASQTLLRLEDVGKTFHMGEVPVEVLRHITFDVRRGELLVMVGPSGSGKTTLLNIMGGLDSPTVGKVWYGQQDLTKASPRELTRFRRNSIGFVFQFYNLVPNLTARENVLVATEISQDPMPVDDTLDLGRAEGSHGSFSFAALRRRAAAGGHRPGAGQKSGAAACATNRPARWTSRPASTCCGCWST